MEAKLQSWLESKEKAKSSQRKVAFGSPFFLQSPGCISSMKKQVVLRSPVNTKAANQGVTVKDSFMSMPQRKLFVTEAASDSCKDDSVCIQESEGLKDLNLSRIKEVLTVLEDRQLNNKSALQELQNSQCFFPEVKEPVAEDSINQIMMNSTSFESTAGLPDELLEDDEKENNRAGNFIQSPPNRPKAIACQSPLRKALSPIDSNITTIPIEEVSTKDNVLSLLLESSAPKTPFIVTREELLELKGIGIKRAEYIIKLRESNSLRSLSDLEKIGLSSKQVHHMFSKAAKDIFA